MIHHNFHSSVISHTLLGALGVFGYAGDGISKSIDRAVHGKTMKKVMAAKQAEAEHLARNAAVSVTDVDVVRAYGRIQGASGK